MPFINDRLNSQKDALAPNGLPGVGSKATNSRFTFDPEKVVDLLRSRIVGQDTAIGAMDDMLNTVKADIGSKQRPLAVNLFLGPTGCGKTETVRVIAEAIHGNSDKLCRIDMNTLAQEHYAAALAGAPPGYVGSKEGQTLLDIEAIQGSFSHPGIVLFDELEKASNEVLRALLNILDTGRLNLASGNKQIDFRNTLVFLTSNIGARDVAQYRRNRTDSWRCWFASSKGSEDKIIENALHRRFDPEFLGRIDRFISFQRLDAQWLGHLFDIELDKLQASLRRREIDLLVDESIRDYFCKHYDPHFGARDLAKRLLTEFHPALARAILQHSQVKSFAAVCSDEIIRVSPR